MRFNGCLRVVLGGLEKLDEDDDNGDGWSCKVQGRGLGVLDRRGKMLKKG